MNSLTERVLALFFFAWLVVTCLCQVQSRLQDRLRQSDLFGLIPRWHFFAPRPAMQDFVLVFRDRTPSGALSPWRETPHPSISHPLLCAVWNPGRRHIKAVTDTTIELMKLVAEERHKREIELSVPYLALLNYVSELPRLDEDCLTQFALVASQSSAVNKSSTVIFVSSLHAIG